MTKKYLQNLELDKIIAMAAERAVCAETRERLFDEPPLTTPEDVRYLLAQTDALATRVVKNGRPRLSACEGAAAAVNRAAKGGLLSMGELLNVRDALRNFASLTNWFKAGEENSTPVDDLFYSITPQPELERGITDAILSSEEMADTASDELYALRRKIRQTESAIRDKLDALVKSPSTAKYLQETLVSIRNGRFVVPVKAEYRGNVAGVIHDVSQSGGTLFVEPTAVVEANAKILQLRNQEQAEIERILGEFTGRVADIHPFFEAGYEAMLQIDMRVAKAELGVSMRGICPTVNDEMHFSFAKARHPLLDPKTAVPVDIALGDGYDTMVITGPNTGGKTVTLKTAGLLSAMAQLGYLLPAHDSTSVCVFEEILVDIGDEQSIEQSLSTFSGHIRNITGILQTVNSRSLVLLDELGAGTDPAEGAALAVSIIERLRESDARIMATTHYAELKLFALDTPGVQNAGSEFDIETLRPTYRLMVGVPGRSNAFLIGEKLGVPPEVTENAKRHLSTEQRRFETVLSQLEDLKLAMRDKEAEIEALRYSAGHQLEEAKARRDALVKQGEEELAAARRQAKDLVDEVQNKAYGLMDEMKALQKDERAAAAQKARRAREIAKGGALSLVRHADMGEPELVAFVPVENVQPGQEVWLPDLGKLATVTALPDKSGQVEVRMGAMRAKYPLAKLGQPPRKSGANQNSRTAGGKSSVARGGTTPGARAPTHELNLIGKNVDEGLMEVDRFIDEAVLRGFETVYIIHGRGTGTLRAAVQQHLRKHKNVKSFRLGRYGEGEDGVTVTELK